MGFAILFVLLPPYKQEGCHLDLLSLSDLSGLFTPGNLTFIAMTRALSSSLLESFTSHLLQLNLNI